MKRFLWVIVAFLMLFPACQELATEEIFKEDGVTVLTVELPSAEKPRTELGEKVDGNYPVYWSEGDKIVVNGILSEEVKIDSNDPRKATYEVRNGLLNLPYAVTYPYVESTTAEQPQVVFPAEQVYTANTFASGYAPMCGYKTTMNEALKLHHLAGVFCFAIKCDDDKTVLKSITITSEKPLSGTFNVDCENETITPTANCSKSITYTTTDEFTLSTSEERLAFITLPYGDLGICHITFTAKDGRVLKAKARGSNVEPGIVKKFSLVFKECKVENMLEEMTETVVDEWADNNGVTVKGYVKSNGKGLEGVVVSDGLLCTKTNVNGFYSLKSNLADTKFVMVSIPSGYTAPTDTNGLPIFYHRVTDSEKNNNLCVADFSFNKISNNSERFTLLIGADPQPRPSSYGYDNNAYHSLDCCEDLYRDMREKAATITDRNVYGLMLGDIVHEDMTLYNNYVAGLKTLGFPMFNVLGNHDNDKTAKTDVEGRRVFEEKLGPTYYSFNIGKLHFVVLDNLIMNLDENGELKKYDVQGLTDEIWQWLQNDLQYVDRSTTLMVAAHSPMFKLINTNNRTAQYREEYGDLFAKFAKVHVWTGHTHNTYNYNYPASSKWAVIEEHTVARSTGELWTNEYLADGTPRGYTVVEVNGNNIEWHFKPTSYQMGSFVSTSKYTSKKPNYLYRDWNYTNGVAKMKSDNSTLSEAYQMKVYKPGQYHNTYADMIAGNPTNNYVYVNVFLWDNKWEKPKYNGVEMEAVGYKDAYCLATYEVRNHYKTYGYTLKTDSGYGPEDNNIHTIFRAVEDRASGSGTVTVTDRFGNNYSSKISW
ncbi:MAG: calcineurin-like phosphoesterase C-terminal domain-containing protein [Alistipes sp.]|nr:calcineurin-like phosphoesterase C-terminal domain-containing protein [Alistipes sp.]